jgi:polyhydroxyalkanoate synthase
MSNQKPLVTIEPDRLQAIQQAYVERLAGLLASNDQAVNLAKSDRRFSSDSWLNSGPFATMAAMYVLNSQTLLEMAKSVQADQKTHQALEFMVQQWVDFASPANFLATNPEAQQKLIDTKGESLKNGIENLLGDLAKGRISQSDETVFEIGKSLATSKGSVVYQNELFQLIQYSPLTEKVGSRPILLVPPAINKFYIMDLQPESSLVRFIVEQGHTVFLVSWRNVLDPESQLTWDDYIEDGILQAISTVKDICQVADINTLGFCVGGTMLTSALAVLAARGDKSVHSLTLMTTLLDFTNTGVLDVFINEQHVKMREATLGEGGLLPGKELSATFAVLRPNDLVWNYVVKNYLKGEAPPAFDILHWNSDSTNLPGPFFAWYLRNMYLENNLVKKNRLNICGEKIDLGLLADLPVYAMGAVEDHIVPWDSAWQSATHLGKNVRYVLGASGHIAGSINPASKNKRCYWTANKLNTSAEKWRESAKEQPGSWWNDWAKWASGHKGTAKAAPKREGRGTQYKSIEPAPGSYVKVRAV